MPTRTRDVLTLSEQLDAMLLGWLERHADRERPGPSHLRARALITVAERHTEEVEAFCARWDMTVRRLEGDAGWAQLSVEGPVLPVEGFTAITGMYRR